jgi:DMSO/TMAO reductase YedYZ molybdopterin-dependent catalytic subunit
VTTVDVRRGAWAGAVAGLTCVAAMEVVARLVGLETLPALLQDPLLAAMPGPVFGFLIDNLQHWGKVLEEAGLLAAMVVVLTVLGGAAAGLARWRADARAGLVAGAAAWLMVMVAVLPVAGKGMFGLADGVQPLVLWALVFAVYALVWEWLARPRTSSQESIDPGRRRFLAALPVGLAAGSLALTGALRVPEWVRSAVTPPEAVRQGPVPAITPASNFYQVSKNFQDPVVSARGWALRVSGLAGRPLRLSLHDLQGIPGVTQVVTLECVSNSVGGPLMSTGRFTGLPLRDLLTMASPAPGARAVGFTARDGYAESLPLETVMRSPEILIAYRLNGAPLPDTHGFPARVLIPGRYGMKGPKWLDSIELRASVENGYWEQQGWDRDAVVRTTARFDVPTASSLLRAGAPAALAGVAFAGIRGVQVVEWTADGGKSWKPASLESPLSPLSWVRWRASWTPGSAGGYELIVRARDATGQLQTSDEMPSFPSGATGYHRISVYVAS